MELSKDWVEAAIRMELPDWVEVANQMELLPVEH